ncbi:GntR family transcriptional regulator [Aquamicrobium zhengzhouense]|uniref:GntR family transcriptional regulator n=1 Tax=Aquamicrobium zhengzhouense TaxID=2781738 RepID=A0ABS0SG69_9HYPH|nr:GntR family transcriptional regulator [Aquamicrobium zhengzhouense]MBI1621671.1 GntR family transcriptional regulator [Aquamicrobium zhengzhouense]
MTTIKYGLALEQLSLGLRPAGAMLSVPEQIADRICTAILSGELKPGQRVAEIPLAQSFNVSRGPVREALRILEHEGLVTFSPRRGAQVTELTPEEVEQLFDIRAALSALAAQSAARQISAEELALLGKITAQLQEVADSSEEVNDYTILSAQAGQILARSANNPRLQAMIQSLSRQTLRYAQLGLSTRQRRQESAKSWRSLFEAIKAGDSERARQINVATIMRSKEAALKLLRGE